MSKHILKSLVQRAPGRKWHDHDRVCGSAPLSRVRCDQITPLSWIRSNATGTHLWRRVAASGERGITALTNPNGSAPSLKQGDVILKFPDFYYTT